MAGHQVVAPAQPRWVGQERLLSGGQQQVESDRQTLLFFFQAEDGIRDLTVTGVQTCALPIYSRSWSPGSTLFVASEKNASIVWTTISWKCRPPSNGPATELRILMFDYQSLSPDRKSVV